MRHSLIAILTITALLTTGIRIGFAQVNSPQKKDIQAAAKEKLKKRVEKIGIGGKITVIRLDERKFYGSVNDIAADDFQITEVDSKQAVNFKYTELKKIRKGDGEKNLFTGKRNNPSAKRGLLIGAAIFGTLIVLIVVGTSDKNF